MQKTWYAKTAVLMVLACIAWGVPAAFAENELTKADFQRVGGKYGVSPYLLIAISEVESQHGTLLGKKKVHEAVNPKQKRYLEKIARHTGRDISEFHGSSAGAMGQMQIMPSTFYTYGQDGNGDGIKDPLDPQDSLATAAYFLARTIAVKGNVRTAIRGYNNSSAYCNEVLALSKKMEMESTFAAKQ
jgi:membrane-bound lytic murein transglycosylase B